MLSMLMFLLGIVGYVSIPKEEAPDVSLPQLYISTSLSGISAADADKLLTIPISNEMKGLNGLSEISSTSSIGHSSVVLEFTADTLIKDVLPDVRENLDKAKVQLPDDATEPRIIEINPSLFPIFVVNLFGDVEENELHTISKSLRKKIESLDGVVEASLLGGREEVLEILVDPSAVESYGLDLQQVVALVQSNNRLVAAGSIESDEGSYSVKLPGLIQSLDDVLSLPVKTVGSRVITYSDIAYGRYTFKDPS